MLAENCLRNWGNSNSSMARPDYLRYLLEYVRAWKGLPEERRTEALADPWAFKDEACKISAKKAWGQREALLHLVHPDSFERMLSTDHKDRVSGHFRGVVTSPAEDRDKLLLQIRRHYEAQYGPELDFYTTKPLHDEWTGEGGADETPWGRFMSWAKLFYDRPDFDEEERDYKLKVAARLKHAKELLFAGDDWLEELKKAFGPPSNLTDWRNHAPFLEWCAADPVAATDALRRFWSDDGVDVSARIDRLSSDVPKESRRGSQLPIAALLLSALSPTDWPIFRDEPVRTACALTEFELPTGGSNGELYSAVLAFWDRLTSEASARGLSLRDRLDAQALMWCVAKNSPPADWLDAQQLAFLAYRGGGTSVPPPLSPDGDVYAFIRKGGYSFPDWLVTDYLVSLATKPLVLLCGISGTGKTKLAQLVAEFAAPKTVEETVDTPELELADTEYTVGLSAANLRTPAYMIPARVAKMFTWPEKGSGIDVAAEWGDQTGTARLNNIAYDTAGNSSGIALSFHSEFRDWLSASGAKTGDVLRFQVLEADPPRVRVALVRSSRRGARSTSGHVAFISVRPDWTDNHSLLGYLNPLTGEYSSTELLRLLLRARQHPDDPHFVILDEMNLAKVEYYFSDFLSAMESGTDMVLHDSPEEVTVELDGTRVSVPRRLQVPRNVFFTGTVNVDETTYMFSPKVLDRANVIEFHDVDLRGYATGGMTAQDGAFRLPQGTDLAALLRHPGGGYEWARPADFAALAATSTDRLLLIHDRLALHNLHFGYRVANEVARFMNLVDRHVGSDVEAEALDLQLLQKVLPKLAGNAARLEQPLIELYADVAASAYPEPPAATCDLPRSAAKIGRMLDALRAVGFASFVE